MPDEMDLWPDDIGETNIVPPVAILREQAALLGRKTNQLLRARVKSTSDSDSGFLFHTFLIDAPALDYTLELFYIRHQVELYPLEVFWRGDLSSIGESQEFVVKLRQILQSPNTQKTIASLLAQVKSESPSKTSTKSTPADDDIPF